MSKPNILTRLVAGKLIDTFNGVVETWNFLCDFVENLRGDGEGDKARGIVVDRSVPDRPVIRIKDDFASGGGDELEVVTGLTFDVSSNKVTATLTKRKIKCMLLAEIPEPTTVDVAEISEVSLVDGVAYNANGNFEITDSKKNVFVVGTPTAGVADAPITTVEFP